MMRILNRKLGSVFASLAIACAGVASTASAATLTTPILGGNENDGIMFDIQTSGNALTLTSIGANITGTANYQIYYKVGTIETSITFGGSGNSANPAAWTLLGSFNNVVGVGTASNQPGGIVEFDIADLSLAANSIYGLYITQTVNNQGLTSGVRYTNLPLGNTVASDSNLSIKSGRGAIYAFTGISNNGRAFNGSLTYSVNAAALPEPGTWGMMILGFGVMGGTMRYRRRAAKVVYA